MMPRLVTALAAFAFATTAATAAPAPKAASVDTLVDGERTLTFELAKKISPSDNAIFSPASIQTALAMAFAGAKGATATEMAKVLHLDKLGGDANALFGQLGAQLAKLDHPDQAFHMANRLFGGKTLAWSQDYLALTARAFGAGLEALDFAGAADAARLHINAWVEDQTNKKITNLLPPGSITSGTRMVLTNAVYFKGAWMHPFEKSATSDQDFFARGKDAVKVATMHETTDVMLGGDKDAQILELPYSHGDIAMDIVLPKDRKGLAALESHLDGSGLVKLLATMKNKDVEVALPKFTVRTSVELSSIFEQLGIKTAFGRSGDFSGMVDKKSESLFIDAIFHQGFVAVDEAGTEAAAATAVVMVTGMAIRQQPQPELFKADHPFVWLLRDTATGEILFYGRIVDPR